MKKLRSKNWLSDFITRLPGQIEEFKTIEKNKVKMYSCGPTVYDYAHIGNFRTYIFSDLLRRFLEYKGFQVIQVTNLTDVDDKIIKKSQELGISLQEYTEKYSKAFFEDIDKLGIEKVEFYPKATEHIPEMINLIKKLEEKGFTYISDNSVYFKISQFKNYGKLGHLDLSGMKTGVRVDLDEYSKEDVKDFALWKGKKGDEPSWETPFGAGRPGWHIECSAMSMKYLGETLDIHTGGEDLIFPHHENEIAQSEAATGKPFVHYWLHCSHLIVEGEKMSKSKGNFFILRDLLEKGYSAKSIRYLLLSTHYRKQLNFTMEGLQGAQTALEKIQNFYSILLDYKAKEQTQSKSTDFFNKKIAQFDENLEDDLNISGALGNLFELISEANKLMEQKELTRADKEFIVEHLKKINMLLNILVEPQKELDSEIQELINAREQARKNKDFALSDKIRDELKTEGIIIEDTKEGIRWKKVK